MNNQFVFIPKNPILRHCSDSFSSALRSHADSSTIIHCPTTVDFKTIRQLLRQITQSKSDDSFSIFLLAVQTDYLILLYVVKFTTGILSKQVKVYYLMHEPRLEKGRVNPLKTLIIFMHQFLFGYLADVILLPSDEAVSKAETFVRKAKICKVNLAFLSVPQAVLEKNLQLLKSSWETRKIFSMLGTASSLDKNPQGFIDFASIFHQLYPEQAQFIRGGRDRGIDIKYDEDLIVRFPSYLSDVTKEFLFHLSHFIVVPYSFSTQSGVLTEALSYGKILIVNDIPAFEQFKKFNFIISIDFNDKKSIVNCINYILAMSFSDYKLLHQSSIQYFRENHSEVYLSKTLNTFL